MAAIVCVALGAATLVQAVGANQTSHFALVRALSSGTARIDAYAHTTTDVARYRNHRYSARAPGLAGVSLPAYEAIRALGVDERITGSGDRQTDRAVWLLSLWAALLPAVLAMLLVRRLGDRLAPGYGAAAGITLGIGTLYLPFSTLLFSHVLAATLAFAAFALLWRERDRSGPDRLGSIAAAGVLVGYGITTEYPTLLAGIALGVYAISRGEVLRRGFAFTAGAVAGIVPLALYNQLAYGSPTHVAYADIRKQQHGFFGIQLPDPMIAVQLLFSSRGLLTLAPVLIMGAVGAVLMYRSGRRAEALVIAAIGAAYLLYNSGYYLPYGGSTPGPRFLIAALPFLALPIAVSYRRLPALTLGLAAVSAACMAIPTMVKPLIATEGDTGQWMRLLEHDRFQDTVLTLAGARGWPAVLPFVACLIAAAALAGAVAPRVSMAWRALGGAAVAVCGWGVLATFAPRVLGIDHASELKRELSPAHPVHVPEKYGSHPISHLVLAAVAVALATLLVAAIAGRRSRSGRQASRAEPTTARAGLRSPQRDARG